jgi:hypothetical protein
VLTIRYDDAAAEAAKVLASVLPAMTTLMCPGFPGAGY